MFNHYFYFFMLAKLFGSNTRAKILKLFFFHPDERYYIRQVARNLDLQVNSVRRELENLEKFGLLVSETGESKKEEKGEEEDKKGKKAKKRKPNKQEKKYFRVNKDFPLFEDAKSLIVKSQILYKDNLVKKLKRVGSPKLLILSGIFVNRLDGAVDVLIVGRISKTRVIKIISSLESDLGREVNFSLMSPSEFKYRRDIVDIFLYDILEGEKIIVIDELGVG